MVLETLKIIDLESKHYAVREWNAPFVGEEPGRAILLVHHCLLNWNQILKELRDFSKLCRDNRQSQNQNSFG